MHRKKFRLTAMGLAFFVAGFSQQASATLLDLGNGLVNDTTHNLTWVKDGALAASNSFGVSGIGPTPSDNMDWDKAQEWIGAMNIANYLGYNDWRLPVCLNAACANDEMTRLWNEEALATTASPFINVGGIGFHGLWLGTEDGPASAWTAFLGDSTYTMEKSWNGGQGAWAVRSGLSTVSSVPVPGAVWLFTSAIAGITALGRRKAA